MRKGSIVLLCVAAFAGCGSTTAPIATPTHVVPAPSRKPVAPWVQKLNRECAEPTSRCHREAAEVEREVRRGKEYARTHKAEAEAIEQRQGHLSPQEEAELEAQIREAKARAQASSEGKEALEAAGK
jgi:hypothetical protein